MLAAFVLSGCAGDCHVAALLAMTAGKTESVFGEVDAYAGVGGQVFPGFVDTGGGDGRLTVAAENRGQVLAGVDIGKVRIFHIRILEVHGAKLPLGQERQILIFSTRAAKVLPCGRPGTADMLLSQLLQTRERKVSLSGSTRKRSFSM